AIASAAGVPVQAGGGVRSLADVQSLLDAGVDRVLAGTAALRNPAWAAEAVRRFGPERIVAAVDVRADRVFVAGWTADLATSLDRVLDGLAGAGIEALLVTDISRDGTLEGPNLDLYRGLRERPFRIVAAGGIARADDLRALAAAGVAGAVAGRALYEGTLTLPELGELSSSLGRVDEARPRCSPRG
ncbi:MAG: 1-(5-phosphoribosyl)-5-((5-phosphoribosylamino)methylideneamino)imidazole-4-carboxamide isomerase, partial [Gemmatimonadetes bacterium]|nr:1-(5-phosphoribosyl)-5-((5-phosphoribosylamino)methylideneamino)imidazole-4-carboxamide isomerase [Gemmatimonadota bacterium]